MREYPNDVPMVNGKVSEKFKEYIKVIITPEEAEILQHLNIHPKKAGRIANILGKDRKEVKDILEKMVENGIIQDTSGFSYFMTFHYLMNIPYKNKESLEWIKKANGVELFMEFFIDEKFYKRYQSSDKDTSYMRVVPIGETIAHKNQIMNVEELHQIIDDNMTPIVVSLCACRLRAEIFGTRECKGKFDIEETCFGFGLLASYFIRRGIGRELTAEEAHELVDKNAKKGHIFITDNNKSTAHQVICSCCECCCSLVRGISRFPDKNEDCLNKSNYIAKVDQELCTGCSLCEKRCAFGAISIDENKKSHVEPEKCFGCGVCAVTCPTEAVRLFREERSDIPENPPDMLTRIYKENRE